MELLRGITLRERLLREGPLPPAEARRIARDVCEALRDAHRHGVVHRDLKPENIFLTDGGTVKILDFGLARVAGQSRLTSQGAIAGTLGYVAPEVLAGEPGDARADLYALGSTWYEMLTGHRWCDSSAPPIDGRDAAALRRALESDPELRFLDAGQFLRALQGGSVPPPPPAAPALAAGDYDVLVHDVVRPRAPLRPIERVLERLGTRASPGRKIWVRPSLTPISTSPRKWRIRRRSGSGWKSMVRSVGNSWIPTCATCLNAPNSGCCATWISSIWLSPSAPA